MSEQKTSLPRTTVQQDEGDSTEEDSSLGPEDSLTYDCIVIGAGISGLTAAAILKAEGLKVLVLEARDRVGGRMLTVEKHGAFFDLGGQWISKTQWRVFRQTKFLSLDTYFQHTAGIHVAMAAGKRVEWKGDTPLRPSLLSAFIKLELLARKVDLDEPYNPAKTPGALALDGQTLRQWLDQNISSPEDREIIAGGLLAVFAEPAEKISMLYVLFYIRANWSLTHLVGARSTNDFFDGAQSIKFQKGAQSLPKGLASLVGSTHICFQSPVCKVSSIPSDNRVTVTLRSGTEIHCLRVVAAIPPVLADSTIEWHPALSPSRSRLQKYMKMGHAVKCLAFYPRAWWREKGLSGTFSAEPKGPQAVALVMDATHPTAKYPALVAFVIGTHFGFSQSTDLERVAMITDDINNLFGVEEQPVDVIFQDWSKEEFSDGCYVGLLPTNIVKQSLALEELRQPDGAIHWAGTETVRQGAGYFEGGIEAGVRAAQEILETRGQTVCVASDPQGTSELYRLLSTPPNSLLRPQILYLGALVALLILGVLFWIVKGSL